MNKELMYNNSMQPLTPENIGDELRHQVFAQDYTPKPKIEGVQILDLRLMVDDGGTFAELIRLDENGNLEALPEFKVRQSSYSEMLPGAVKAFHLHYNQEDVWFVAPTDRLVIGLIDARKDSPTYNVNQRFVMGAGRAQLLYIPRGVAHGAANISPKSSTIVYFVNQHFNLQDADEQRLPWDILGKDFWQMTMG
jgi:dTDP-4-dehydrorhamnose 3,5-epimerase-like enzyme